MEMIDRLRDLFKQSRKPFEHAIGLLEAGIEEINHLRYRNKVDVEYIEQDLKNAIEILKKEQKDSNLEVGIWGYKFTRISTGEVINPLEGMTLCENDPDIKVEERFYKLNELGE